jgi:hypothetical protein
MPPTRKAGTRIVTYTTIAWCTPRMEGGHMVALRCGCEQGTDLWGEFWWIEGEHRWVFFDEEKTNETYGEQLTHCPHCGRLLERKALKVTTPSLRP